MKKWIDSIVIVLFCCVLCKCSSKVDTNVVHLKDIGGSYEWRNYKIVEGTQLSLHIFYPYGHKFSDSRPAVVCIHGGGFAGGHPYLFYPHCRYFASRGAVAISINYRFVDEKGLEAFDAIKDCLADCKSAIRYIRSNAGTIGIDPDRIAVVGDSAGGHLAAALGTIDDFDDPGEDLSVSSMANAMVLYNPVVDVNLPALINLFKVEETGSALKEHTDLISPVYYVAKGQPPALVMHGTADTNVPIEQSYRFTEAMKKSGNRCEMHALEGTKHAFVIVGYGTESTIVDALRVTDRFLVSLGYLEGEPTIEMSERE